MESKEGKKRRRGRPRKRKEHENDWIDNKVGCAIKKQALEIRWMPLVGKYVLKEFDSSVFIGKIVSYDTGLYRVEYEDGDCEDLDSGELREIILGEEYFDDDLSLRRTKLDELVLKRSVKNKEDSESKVEELKIAVDRVETVDVPAVSELSGGVTVEDDGALSEYDDADSSSDSCEYAQDGDLGLEAEALVIPPPQLPPSSGNVGVPEEYVSHLFSVYMFLRSFNIRLFLSPFTLDDFVGAINCRVQNTLLDAIHVALMRALKRHLETLSLDGLELASRCLRCIEWSLLDPLTWPAYLIHYFTVMGYVKGLEWKGFYEDLLKGEYYSIPVGRKLMILQILCDDVLESAELRAEIDIREESEVGIDPDAAVTNLPENGPRRVHPRYSKTSACKEKEAMEIIAEGHGTKSSCSSKDFGSTGTEGDVHIPDVDVDGNSDECRLCGMDGTLLCCDGCPSAYHSRCIGVVKMYIPEGPWYCPECTINKLGPTITMGTSLRGAEIFGIDLYEQVFLGACDHLLVLRASIGREQCLRYYNQKDIPKVLQELSASVQHRSLYWEIFQAIARYWHIPQSAFFALEAIEGGLHIQSVKEDEKFSTLSLPSFCKENHKIPSASNTENTISFNGSSVDNAAVSCLDTSVSGMNQANPHGIVADGDAARTQNGHFMNMRLPVQIKMEPTDSVNLQADPSDVTHQNLVDRSSAIEHTACTSANSDGSHIGHANGTFHTSIGSSQSKEGNHGGFRRAERNSANNCLYVGTYFKPYAYINSYMHGDFAASAAANLAILSSEESRALETHKSRNGRKIVADVLLQAKAFSTAAHRFFWPSSEKKLVEVPRERCGWCYACKLPSTNKRACMLNSAALTATKGAMKILLRLRPTVNGDGSLSTISTYILYMGEVLCGLTVGPFLNASYREQWHKRVEDASTCCTIKGALLELEENIRMIALFGDWAKAMDDLLVDSSCIQTAASTVGTTQKRGPNGKRHRKQSGMHDITAADCHDKGFIWWRGGKLSKQVFHKAILPQLMVKRAARQGGSRKIAGIFYADDSEVPKRSRRLVWRAAVERSKNASQLALQVRYLDIHVRWSDLFRPDQVPQDGNGPETEASVFRNAVICDKKIEENKIMYGVAFGSQKHLPSRVMKNVIEVQQVDDGKDKYWFSEMHVPLYLIKEYEESADKVVLPSAKKSSNELSELQRQQLKASRRDIFLYLACKRDKLDRCPCASCQLDVLLGNTIKCSACQGYCHKDCTVGSTRYVNGKVDFLITCKKCCYTKAVAHNDNSNESPTSPLPLQRQECHTAITVTKTTRINIHNQPLAPVKTLESSSERKQATSGLGTKNRSRLCNWGVIWRKKSADTGIDFRHKHILLRGSSDRNWLRPVCNLCKKPYDSDLMYIHCQTCNHWFHAEAVELGESRLSDVIGFKCCRCRRIKPPRCPYKDEPGGEKPEDQKPPKRVLSQGYPVEDSGSGTIAETKVHEPTTPIFPKEEVFVRDDDPLLFSLSKFEQITALSKVEQVTGSNSGVDFEWNIAGQGPQKLPVRRYSKHQDVHVESSVPHEINNFMNPKEELPSCAEWDVSAGGPEGAIMFDYGSVDYENMEFEPQTYFSFTELLASDDGDQLGGFDASGNVLETWENQSDAVSHDGVSEQYAVGTSGDGQGPCISVKSAGNTMHCKMCSHMEPAPDLFCEICGLMMHRHCSPWVESLAPVGSWRCGHCREWR